MAWIGYYEYDGTEIINVERTEKYVGEQNTQWFRESYDLDVLEQVFNTTYNNPIADGAPWIDPDRIDSFDFWGAYPISIEGVEDSTRSSTVTEYIRNGGNPGRLRHGTKSVVFSAALLGGSECAVEYGFNWLKSALLGAPCQPGGDSRCYGADLTYFSCEPAIEGGTASCFTAASDAFQRINAAGPTLGLPDTGPAWRNIGTSSPTWGIDASFYAVALTGSAGISLSVVDTGLKDGVLECTYPVMVTAGDNNGGVAIRVIDETHCIIIGESRIYVETPTGQTQIGPDFTQEFASGDRVRVDFRGPLIRVYRQAAAAGDYVLVGEGVTEAYMTVGTHGMYEFNAGTNSGRWNDFLVTSCVEEAQFVYANIDGGTEPTAPDQMHVSDFFDRGDSSTLGLADTGQAWVYGSTTGTTAAFGIEGMQAKVINPPAVSGYHTATINAGTGDVVLECVISEVSSDPFSGMMFRRDPAVVDSGFVADRSDIYVGPSFSSVASYTGPDFAAGDRMRIYLSGQNIRVDKMLVGTTAWITVLTTTHASYVANTYHGFAGWSDESASARWDEFRIMYDTPGYPIVDGGAPDTIFTNSFDGGAPNTVFPIKLFAPLPAPFEFPAEEPNTDPTGCIQDMQRSLKNVQINSGPTVTAKKYMTDGSCMWTVQWTAVAGDPFEYGHERVVVDGFLSGEGGDPFGEDVDGPYNTVGYNLIDDACPPAVWEALYDPLCPALVAPPGPVDIPAGCFEATNEWWRRFFSVPKEFVPLWGSSVPVIGLEAQFDDLRNVRVRIYADPLEEGNPEADQCSTVADLLVSYVPQGYSLVLDGVRQAVYAVDQDGVSRRADSLVFASDGKPISWPELTCGYGYLVTVDTMESNDIPAVDFSLVPKVT